MRVCDWYLLVAVTIKTCSLCSIILQIYEFFLFLFLIFTSWLQKQPKSILATEEAWVVYWMVNSDRGIKQQLASEGWCFQIQPRCLLSPVACCTTPRELRQNKVVPQIELLLWLLASSERQEIVPWVDLRSSPSREIAVLFCHNFL